MNPPALVARDLGKTFRRQTGDVVHALAGISTEAAHGSLVALVGPDGAGKTTFIRLSAGLMSPDAGELDVLGVNVAVDPQQIQSRIGYMPQRFGLYEDLSVQENLDLYADLHGVTPDQRQKNYPRLMEMTGLGPFTRRLAGRLSGGMKQKLGLACTLVRSPELLLLDEPTVGVDPLSRRELWEIIFQLVRERGLTVLVSTSYLDEAERCDHAVLMHQGRVLEQGAPREVTKLAEGRTFMATPGDGEKARQLWARLMDEPDVIDAVPEAGRVRFVRSTIGEGQSFPPLPPEEGRGEGDGEAPLQEPSPQRSSGGRARNAVVSSIKPRFEDGFMIALRRATPERASTGAMTMSPHAQTDDDRPVVQVHDLVRRFGNFTAVDHVSFEVRRGEIFGLLGPNGAGKTTTFRMLCGLLPATGGTLQVTGVDLLRARASARQRIGYVAQKFSLYGQLSVAENLEFFAGAYGLHGKQKRRRIDWAMHQFELSELVRLPSGQLPGGYKQRLSMAAALLHEPEVLFLDEPTSGADPLARREFWRRITSLSDQQVTVIVTTHFMEEAEYCDRIVILDAGRVLAEGTPADVRQRAASQPGHEPTLEDAFISIVQQARESDAEAGASGGAA
jgi:ABC-2 type transport system ATP-binding protein